jgi:predicted nucleotidyltransferase
MVTQAQINEIIKRIVENYNPERVIVFGSYAKGRATEDSDLDLLIIKDTNIPRYKRGREVRKYLRGLKVPIDLIVYTEDEIQNWRHVKTAFITTVMKEGRVLYEAEK